MLKSAAEPPADKTPPAAADKPYYHDGFYLQLGLGLAGVAGEFNKFNDHIDSIEFFGGSGAFEVAIGGTVTKGLVVGGGLYTLTPFKLRVRDGGETHSAGRADIALLGVFVDWYLKPDSGFHLQGAIGPSFGTVQSNGSYFEDDDFSGRGIGLMMGVGYEAFVSPQWSLGGIAQLQFGDVRMTGNDTDEKFDLSYAAPMLLFNGTFH